MLNEKLKCIQADLYKYIVYDKLPPLSGDDIENWVLDIEVCPADSTNTKVLVYSIAIMDCSNNYICYKYNDIKKCLNDLMNVDSKHVNIYIHNLFYDIKPFFIELIRKYGNKEIQAKYYTKIEYNKFTNKKEELLYQEELIQKFDKVGQYTCILNKGQMYQFNICGRPIKRLVKKRTVNYFSVLQFKDTLKILPFSLQKCCKDFLNLDLPKEDLDYNKIRKADDELTKEELIYIYNDVFGLSRLVQKMIINGEEINGKIMSMNKMTTSSQALYNYKHSLLEDYYNNDNMFKNSDFYDEVDNRLMETQFFTSKNEDKKADYMFRAVYPHLTFAEYGFIKHSYFGGLCCVDFDNVEKFKNDKDKNGVVLDVNSLYPSMMVSKLLPYGRGIFSQYPYQTKDEEFKNQYPLYFQEIIIHDLKVKNGKMHWLQVKDRLDFNGREVIKENINLNGEKVSIRLVLSNVLLDLLFECYDVKLYELGYCIAYKGTYDLFKNYISFWGDVKKNSTGSKRARAKLMLNSLYGKFGSSACCEITHLNTINNTFNVEHEKATYVRESVYLPMASFITSYAKEFLVNAINSNRQYFMYCDTDSIHLKCTIDKVKGVIIHDKNFSCWCHEMSFNDYKYIGAKRYAEKNSNDNKWEIKCCGLTDKIMKQVDDIEVFANCELNQKELNNIPIYTKDDTVYYYYDKDCTRKIKGLIKSKKARQVEYGTLIITTPYAIR